MYVNNVMVTFVCMKCNCMYIYVCTSEKKRRKKEKKNKTGRLPTKESTYGRTPYTNPLSILYIYMCVCVFIEIWNGRKYNKQIKIYIASFTIFNFSLILYISQKKKYFACFSYGVQNYVE